MSEAKDEKTNLHPRNKHRSRYDFAALVKAVPALRDFIKINPYGDESVDFADPGAVKTLNAALLKHFYGISHWDIPVGYLCPPVPGRADYIHYLADLLAESHNGVVPTGRSLRVLDIGVGANCIYPIVGHQEYGWTFVGSDVDRTAVKSAQNIVAANPELQGAVQIRLQENKQQILKGIIKPGETFDLTMCNPPFHASAEEAAAGSGRKLRNLGKQSKVLNFGGQQVELWVEGGEQAFIRKMVFESAELPKSKTWYTSLVSKNSNLPGIYNALEKVKATSLRSIEMAQGQKISRFVAWNFGI
ncbi:23S rRNA (adenine(1618)-N(6))-methyltransferase RlmF [Pedobacter sp. SAFR-022]|uniref:23S rRNA (adenine(1618)-N(6))-methyltransferase RlmF n=1 Tax=Pedobacter sp. SAFR-022 TaxID=3436861 RepID=UPI003F80D14E